MKIIGFRMAMLPNLHFKVTVLKSSPGAHYKVLFSNININSYIPFLMGLELHSLLPI